ncbi:MAG: S8 family serine peptidase [Candidatus Electrothrix sp. YB6]
MKVLSLSVALVVIFSWHCTSFAKQPKDKPEFKEKQVVVHGTPEDFPGYKVVKYLEHANLTVLEVAKGNEKKEVKALRKKGRKAELNYIAWAYASVDDPYYSSYQWHLPRIQSEQAWGLTTGTGVTVAVLDTGLATGGTDGIGCVVPGYDFVNSDNDPSDGHGHGTHVSGTVAQSTDNGVGCAGMAYGACVMPVKVLSDTGSGSFADVADGIYWAVDNGALVINMSLGAHGYTSISYMDEALDYAHSNDVTVVAAAGNDSDTTQVSYPAIYPTTIAVGATDSQDAVAGYSNRGNGLDVVAPGSGVVQETFSGTAWGYYSYNGTSMATPHVAATAAMLIAYDTASTPDDVYAALTETAFDLGAIGYDSTFGHGLIQAYDALTYQGGPVCTDNDNDNVCTENGDCNDSNADIYPGATETCDGIDNNCDGTADEGCPVCTDNDNDGVCVEDGDCNDGNADIYPGAAELCDGIDNNCDGTVDEGCSVCTDNDNDGFCVEDGDCNDNDPEVYPGHKDKGNFGRDGVDNDCNGVIDG